MSAALFVPFLFLYFSPRVFATSCPTSISCGSYKLGILPPFYTNTSDANCRATYLIQCLNLVPLLAFPGQDFMFPVFNISYEKKTIILHDLKLSLSPYRWGPDCVFLYRFRAPILRANVTELSTRISNSTGPFFSCDQKHYDFNQSMFTPYYNQSLCKDYDLYYTYKQGNSTLPGYCATPGPYYFSWKLSFSEIVSNGGGFSLLSAGFSRSWDLQRECFACGINCSSDGAVGESTCTSSSHCRGVGKKEKRRRILLAGVAAGVAGFILASVLCFLCYCYKMRVKHPLPPLVKFSSSEKLYPKEITLGAANYPTHIFSYRELQEATNNFDTSQEIGDGGFGTVYRGKLRDGRIVAVKRLYENNCKRLEQFMNEIAILSHLRHHNLVALYGCTSHLSRELLLVYEFVANGTVADHLHGHLAAEKPLPWPLRLNIAIETAEALTYLHAIEPPVIHRDVKSNNILLDNNFHVKVADFGLSRLFPADATHVSTAPQGTPGYLDPEYHRCYQLTDKSDVYSFGVVLVELISSKPAVDINRHKNEINLACMALSKIQNHELERLVDPGLGYLWDVETRKMITLVAELAFRCLQMESDMRPPIREVLEGLREIESCRTRAEKEGDVRVVVDSAAGLLNTTELFSPNSVMGKWESRDTTPSTSGSSTT